MIIRREFLPSRPRILDFLLVPLHPPAMATTNHPDVWTPVDPLGEALHFLRMSGSFYCRSEFTAPWGLELPALPDCLMLHVVIVGECWLDAGEPQPRQLRAGDLALVPHGTGHRITSAPGARSARLFDLPRETVSERYEILRLGGGGTGSTLLCGAVRFGHPAARHLVSLLPPTIVVDGSVTRHGDWIESTVRLMAAEARELRPGGETVITRLADILVIQAIRTWIERDAASRTGWLGALQDRHIGRAIMLIHRDPSRAWTLSSLATEVAMSRSAFAARFTALVGMPAMQYVARWRMHTALDLLGEDDSGLRALATRMGYQSEAAFSRAFKKVIGMTPGAARRNAYHTASSSRLP